jgi:hypothetical protein
MRLYEPLEKMNCTTSYPITCCCGISKTAENIGSPFLEKGVMGTGLEVQELDEGKKPIIQNETTFCIKDSANTTMFIKNTSLMNNSANTTMCINDTSLMNNSTNFRMFINDTSLMIN